jgi:BCD family chlorophyll transporter-like MFS transporter
MGVAHRGQVGLVLGVWGAVQASAAGGAAALGGITHDAIAALAQSGALGPALSDASIGYSFVYHIEIYLLFATLVAIGPLVRPAKAAQQHVSEFALSGLSGKPC